MTSARPHLAIELHVLALALACMSIACDEQHDAGDGGANDECYSPTQNLDRAYEDGAVGCQCDDAPEMCVGRVALICNDSRWQAVEDGPCAPMPGICPDGTIVDSASACLQDDAFCRPLPDGRYCTGSEAPHCPEGSQPIARDVECPAYAKCFDYSESLRCARRAYTPAECAGVGGTALADPGDGSLLEGGCPSGATALGFIDADWDEGGLCCPAADGCAPQQTKFIGTCEPAPRYYWNGRACEGRTGCRCEGADCEAGYASAPECERGFRSCNTPTHCGARAGTTCNEDEYCAYVDGQYCGAADAEAVCKRKPNACDQNLSPVCGCDGKTYDNACTANTAGTGVLNEKPCE